MGIRLALGAGGADVVRLVMRAGVVLAGTGIVIGTVAGVRLTRFIEQMLWGVEPTDPLTFVGVAALLGATALLASFVPAWRASRTDPLETLRAE